MVTMRQDMEDVAEKAVQYALKLGASDCDAVACESKFNVAEIEKSSVKQASSVATFGIGVRTFVKGCAGFSSGTGMDGRSMRRVVELSVSQAEGGTSDPDFKGLPPKKRPSKVRGLFDPRIARLTSGDVVEMAIRRLGAISKRGDVYLRMLLIHGARAVLAAAPQQREPDRIRRWALELAARVGHNKATVALANKLARLAWAVWKNDRAFESLPKAA